MLVGKLLQIANQGSEEGLPKLRRGSRMSSKEGDGTEESWKNEETRIMSLETSFVLYIMYNDVMSI